MSLLGHACVDRSMFFRKLFDLSGIYTEITNEVQHYIFVIGIMVGKRLSNRSHTEYKP